ncbi:MAG TPA: hypothetical protein VGZ22_31375 [Isosphaeraceae bacterium]|nr:hypothetical protein [Isosphaeraceae bacterium]
MQIPVLIEPVAGNSFRARSGEPFALAAEGTTRGEALQRLRELIATRIATGTEVVTLEVTASEHPWASLAGMLQGDPLLEPWKQAMAEYRRQVDEDPEA